MRWLVVFVGLLSLTMSTPVALAGTPGGPATLSATQPAVDSTGTTIDVSVRTSGDAQWNISKRYVLETDNDSAAFQKLGDRFEAGDADTGFTIDAFRTLASSASEETGRSMAIQSVERTAFVVENPSTEAAGSNTSVGVLSVQFTWSRFARIDGDKIFVGDAFTSHWDLQVNQTLAISPPATYAVQSFSPSTQLQDGVLRWDGEDDVTFGTGQPQISYVERATPPTTEPPTTGLPGTRQPSTTGGGAGDFGGLSSLALLLGGGVLLAATLGPLAVWRRDELAAFVASVAGTAARTSDSDTEAETAANDATTATEGTTDPEPGSSTAEDTGDGPSTADAASSDQQPSEADSSAEQAGGALDPELLSDEERVEQLLEGEGGRMKQAAIVTETDWSNAKVSQLLSAMDEDGRIEKLRIGRENLISLDGFDETGFDEE